MNYSRFFLIQFDREREIYQAHVSQLAAEAARMHSLRERVMEMQVRM
jgi:hypothetical protein